MRFFLFALASMCVMSVVGNAQDSKPKRNAALKYWQAYASMSRALKPDTKEKVDSYFLTKIDDLASKAVSDCEHAMTLLHKGAKLKNCAWEIDLDDGPNSTVEHYEPVRALARLACLSARHHFEKGLASAGVDDIFALIALGRHVGTDNFVICKLTQSSIENVAIMTLARYLPKLKRDELVELQKRLKKLPSATTDRKRNLKKPTNDLEKAMADLTTRHKLLEAAVAFVLDGPNSLSKHPDPYGNGPFLYSKLEQGFELRSKLGKYVRVTVGQVPRD